MPAPRLIRFAAALAVLTLALPARAEPPKVVATIAPLHSLVAAVMDGVATPRLLLPGGTSPHAYALKPSDSRALAEAKVVFWIGETMETFLERPLKALAGKARLVEVLDLPDIVRHRVREGGIWEGEADRDHAPGKDSHGHGAFDAHVWLDPTNARAIVAAAAGTLAEVDPANAPRYRANADLTRAALDALDARTRARLAPVAARPYLVFHDAYQYFERRYGLKPSGAVTVSANRPPGAKRLLALRERIRKGKVVCVFIEPQFEPRLAQIVVEGTNARLATLDPIGAALAPGKEAYVALIDGLAASLASCLAGTR